MCEFRATKTHLSIKIKTYTFALQNPDMRKLLTFFVLLIASTSFSQIQVRGTTTKADPVVGEVKNMGSFVAELTYKVDEGDTVYTLRYRNAKYTTLMSIESVRFSNEGNTVDELYKILMSVFSDENKKNKEYKVQFKLGEKEVIVSNFRMWGATSAMFFTMDGHCYLSEKQIKKLFGKD